MGCCLHLMLSMFPRQPGTGGDASLPAAPAMLDCAHVRSSPSGVGITHTPPHGLLEGGPSPLALRSSPPSPLPPHPHPLPFLSPPLPSPPLSLTLTLSPSSNLLPPPLPSPSPSSSPLPSPSSLPPPPSPSPHPCTVAGEALLFSVAMGTGRLMVAGANTEPRPPAYK